MSDQERARPPIQDGFWFPYDLVKMGWHEWKETGRIPNPHELAARVPSRWRDDLYTFDEAINRSRPSDGNEQG